MMEHHRRMTKQGHIGSTRELPIGGDIVHRDNKRVMENDPASNIKTAEREQQWVHLREECEVEGTEI